jgi:hypothetical protein
LILKQKIQKGIIMKTLITLVVIVIGFVFTAFSSGDFQTINGTITDNIRPCGSILTDDGREYKVHLGPIWYWEENKYELKLSSATIKGVIDGNDIYPYEITQDGKTMTFTDEKGNPKWYNGNYPGRGNGRGNGKGRGDCWRNK